MELNAETSLRKTPLWRRVFNLSLFAVVVFAVYSYRATPAVRPMETKLARAETEVYATRASLYRR
jgi:hypothetical protein